MSRLYGGRGAMARELFVQLLREYGPLTNSGLARAARLEADLWMFGWSIDPHMRKLEAAGRVERVQVARGHTILWTVPGERTGGRTESDEERTQEWHMRRMEEEAEACRRLADRLRVAIEARSSTQPDNERKTDSPSQDNTAASDIPERSES